MDDQQKSAIINNLEYALKRANSAINNEQSDIAEYWKGQVFGTIKTIRILKLESFISCDYYMNQLY